MRQTDRFRFKDTDLIGLNLILVTLRSTVKTRMQCSPVGTYSGPLECLMKTVKVEGLRALYKGASPPGKLISVKKND